jgi:hypothetical protein
MLVACVCALLPLASVFVGIAELDQLIFGDTRGDGSSSLGFIGNIGVSSNFLTAIQVTGALSKFGFLMIAAGFFQHARRLAPTTAHPAAR